jgi:molybdenum cofactor cytidylyltransferase
MTSLRPRRSNPPGAINPIRTAAQETIRRLSTDRSTRECYHRAAVPAAILPAAGASRRMGRAKLLLPFRGDTILGSLVAALHAGGVGRIVVVRAPGDDALAAWCREAGVDDAVNPAPERGMLSSIQAGLAALGGALALRRERLAVCPADLPLLTAGTVATLLRSTAPLAVPSYRGRRGHPLVLAGDLAPEIEQLDPAVGLRQLLERRAADLQAVAVDDPGILLDVDTPEAYEAALAVKASPSL